MGTVTMLLIMGGILGIGLLIGGTLLLVFHFTGKEHSPELRANASTTGQGQWFAQVKGGGDLLWTGPWGVLDIGAGQVAFTRDGGAAPDWSVPAAEVAVDGPGLGPDLGLVHPRLGALRIRVSTSRNARWRSGNDINNVRDRETVRTVIRVLQGWGARAA